MKPVICSECCLNSWRRRAATTKRTPETAPWFMGTPRLCLCGCSSTEQILQTVHSPPALSLLRHIVCALAFHSGWRWGRGGGGIALRATEQTVEKGACHLYSVPRRTCLFLFFYLSSKLPSWAQSFMSESWINCFKPKGRATHHQKKKKKRSPEMFYWRLLKLSQHTRCTNIWSAERVQLCFQPFIYGFQSFQGKIVDVLLALSRSF